MLTKHFAICNGLATICNVNATWKFQPTLHPILKGSACIKCVSGCKEQCHGLRKLGEEQKSFNFPTDSCKLPTRANIGSNCILEWSSCCHGGHPSVHLSVTDVLWLNGAREGCYWSLIGSRILAFKWHKNRSQWMTLKSYNALWNGMFQAISGIYLENVQAGYC